MKFLDKKQPYATIMCNLLNPSRKKKGSRKDKVNGRINGNSKEKDVIIRKQPNFMKKIYEEYLTTIKDQSSFCVHGKTFKFSKMSLGLFDNKSKTRIFFVWLVTSKWFESFIIFLILLNSLFLGIKDYNDFDNLTSFNQFVEKSEPVFTYIFLFECISKIIAQGFLLDNNTYLSDSWNLLDFFVVVTSLLDQLPAMKNVSGLRTFRLFRPLRSLQTMPSMKLLIGTLLKSMKHLGGILGLVTFFFIIFAILGVSLWDGKIHFRCYETEFPNEDGTWKLFKEENDFLCSADRTCPAGSFCGSLFEAKEAGYYIKNENLWIDTSVKNLNYGITNFDNVFSAFLTIF